MDGESKKTILLVEDDPVIAMAEAVQLQECGYQVECVVSGADAIRAVADWARPIHLILMDLNLGQGQDGTEVARVILKERPIPIIFLSNRVETEIAKHTEDVISYGFVVKNSELTVLDASIKMALRLQSAQQKVAFYEKRYRRLFEAARDGVLILDAFSGKIVDVNPFLVELLGYTKEEFLDKSLWDLGAFKNVTAAKEMFQELKEKEYVRYHDLPLETALGKLIHVEFVSNVYLVDDERVIQCNIRDITDRMKLEKVLTDGMVRKDELLRELQHRTKNSFNMITSLMLLRAEVAVSEETKVSLEEMTMRVRSISDLYSLLYETDSFFDVPLQVYCLKVIDSMVSFSRSFQVRKEIEDLPVTAKDAATIGMILVELLTNTFKYAFPDGRAGSVDVKLVSEGTDFILTVEDNGVGLPEHFDLSQVKSMGLHLVQILVDQLRGQISMETDHGTKVRVVFQNLKRL